MRNCTCPRNFALVAFVPSRRVHVTHTTRNVHSFITLSSRTRNHLTPSEVAISEMTTRSPYVTSVPTLKPPDPPSLSLSLSLSRSVSRSFHRSPSSCLVLLDVDLVKRDFASRIFHDPCVSADTRIDNHDESILSSILPASYLIPSIPDVVLRKFRFSGTICRPRIWESISRTFPISSMQF